MATVREEDLPEINGLIARMNSMRGKAPESTLFAMQLRLLGLGVALKDPILSPDPTAPPGGSAVALRKVA